MGMCAHPASKAAARARSFIERKLLYVFTKEPGSQGDFNSFEEPRISFQKNKNSQSHRLPVNPLTALAVVSYVCSDNQTVQRRAFVTAVCKVFDARRIGLSLIRPDCRAASSQRAPASELRAHAVVTTARLGNERAVGIGMAEYGVTLLRIGRRAARAVFAAHASPPSFAIFRAIAVVTPADGDIGSLAVLLDAVARDFGTAAAALLWAADQLGISAARA